MPKKAARGGAQRHKPKAQKSVQLVRPVSPVSVKEEEIEEITSEEETQGAVATQTAEAESETENFPTLSEEPVEEPVTPVAKKATAPVAKKAAASEAEKEVMVPFAKKGTSSASEKEVKGSAAKKAAASVTEKEVVVEEEKPAAKAVTGRAARRQTGQRAQPRAASSLISPEHFAYVRKDLIFIAILAIIMFSIIIILHFVPAIGG